MKIILPLSESRKILVVGVLSVSTPGEMNHSFLGSVFLFTLTEPIYYPDTGIYCPVFTRLAAPPDRDRVTEKIFKTLFDNLS
jgi:hypothetical protein